MAAAAVTNTQVPSIVEPPPFTDPLEPKVEDVDEATMAMASGAAAPPPDSPSSSSPSRGSSPRSPVAHLSSAADDSASPDSSTQPDNDLGTGTGNAKPTSSSATGAPKEREKRKRSRVTPEQLAHLERFFALDRIPTAARRREISEMLGMQERQTQIWFQNRRAKAKLMEGKNRTSRSTARAHFVNAPPEMPPALAPGYEADLHNLLNEDEPISIIPSTDLTIGSWRRVASVIGKHDLVTYISEPKRCMTWFIHSVGSGFKMVIPFETIVDVQFSNIAPGNGLASFYLTRPPLFFIEQFRPAIDGSTQRYWKRCADWTEGTQASLVMRHDLTGSAVQLAHVLRMLAPPRPSGSSQIQLPSPSYVPQVEPPPMDALPPLPTPIPSPSVSDMATSRPGTGMLTSVPVRRRKRSFSGPPILVNLDYSGDQGTHMDRQAGLLHSSSPSTLNVPVSQFLQPMSHSPSNSSGGYPTPVSPITPENFGTPPDYGNGDGGGHHQYMAQNVMLSPTSDFLHASTSLYAAASSSPRSYMSQSSGGMFFSSGEDSQHLMGMYDANCLPSSSGSERHSHSPFDDNSPLLAGPYQPEHRTISPDGMMLCSPTGGLGDGVDPSATLMSTMAADVSPFGQPEHMHYLEDPCK